MNGDQYVNSKQPFCMKFIDFKHLKPSTMKAILVSNNFKTAIKFMELEKYLNKYSSRFMEAKQISLI